MRWSQVEQFYKRMLEEIKNNKDFSCVEKYFLEIEANIKWGEMNHSLKKQTVRIMHVDKNPDILLTDETIASVEDFCVWALTKRIPVINYLPS